MLAIDPMASIATLRDYRSMRASSFDATGGNADFWIFEPGETRVLANISGAGVIRHIWMTAACQETAFLRKVVIRMFWDREK